MSKYVVSIEQLRSIEWARSWNWAIIFHNAPPPFNEWFPATSVTENFFAVEKMDFVAGLGNFAIPKSTMFSEIKINVFDGGKPGEAKSVIRKWMRAWSSEICSLSQGYTRTLEEICRDVTIVHYDGKGGNFEASTYKVFPYGNYDWRGTSASEVDAHDFDLIIAATLNTSY